MTSSAAVETLGPLIELGLAAKVTTGETNPVNLMYN